MFYKKLLFQKKIAYKKSSRILLNYRKLQQKDNKKVKLYFFSKLN